jgi:hypothetical protein
MRDLLQAQSFILQAQKLYSYACSLIVIEKQKTLFLSLLQKHGFFH